MFSVLDAVKIGPTRTTAPFHHDWAFFDLRAPNLHLWLTCPNSSVQMRLAVTSFPAGAMAVERGDRFIIVWVGPTLLYCATHEDGVRTRPG